MNIIKRHLDDNYSIKILVWRLIDECLNNSLILGIVASVNGKLITVSFVHHHNRLWKLLRGTLTLLG